MNAVSYDAVLLVAFGGPEGMADVMPFLENVLRGRNVPEARKREVAHHYARFGGVSPLNEQNRKLKRALEKELQAHGLILPVYWGNRNWQPFVEEAVREMAADGVRHALALFPSAYSSYSSCRQYRENRQAARQRVGGDAPAVHKLRAYFNHPLFIRANAARLRDALARVPPDRRARVQVLFTAHSLPLAMAKNCAYERQLRETARLVAHLAAMAGGWHLVWQSRSGPPSQAWLEPDVCEALRELASRGVRDVVVAPIGFISDHMEVIYDLDLEAAECAEHLGIQLVRAATVGTHPAFLAMIRELIQERLSGDGQRPFLGRLGPGPDTCPQRCCEPGGAERCGRAQPRAGIRTPRPT